MTQINLSKSFDDNLFHCSIQRKVFLNVFNVLARDSHFAAVRNSWYLSINNLKLYNTEKVCKEQYNTWNNSQYSKPILNSIFAFLLHEINQLTHKISAFLLIFFSQKWN